MKQRPKQPLPAERPTASASDADSIVQIKVWLLGVSPVVWRRVLMPAETVQNVGGATVGLVGEPGGGMKRRVVMEVTRADGAVRALSLSL